ncbi:AI-2E family transporter [Natronolimnobius baerhuensis]|uniref:AI-2E family transporter n=1 Tax=Natronolimnobius baerhuensis TaxID=253108 RepID=A0A202E3S7_9EURY|nr:AI-2E family transporter [Natronolimnobius baerhuensis]OVE82864.1 AI-2E family transporter [Natronolimnobius baerhuensis]
MDLRIGFLLLLVALLGAISVLLALPLLQYIMAAVLLAFVLFPLHDRLEGRTVRVRGTAITISPRVSAGVVTVFGILATVIPLLIFTVLLLQTVLSFVNDLGDVDLVETARTTARELGFDETVLNGLEAALSSELEGFLNRGLEFALQELLRLLDTSFQVGLGLLVLVFLLYYFLVDGRRLVAWIGSVAPIDDEVRRELIDEVDAVTWAVLRSHVLVAIAEGVLGGIGLYVLGVPNVAFWTVVMIIVSFLPAIGVWLVWGPIVGYLFVMGDSVGASLLLVYGFTVLSVVDNYLRAVLVDLESGVHPGTVLIGVIGGLYLFGMLGLLLGPVLLATFKAVVEVFSEAYDPAERTERTPSP